MLRADRGRVVWGPAGEGMLGYFRLHSAALRLASRALFLRWSVSIISWSSALERPLLIVPLTEVPLCSIFTQSAEEQSQYFFDQIRLK